MAIHETKRQTDIEKRLRQLRDQVYGKETEVKKLTTNNSSTDISFLYKDLLKIAVFATVAFSVQFVLFLTLFERG